MVLFGLAKTTIKKYRLRRNKNACKVSAEQEFGSRWMNTCIY